MHKNMCTYLIIPHLLKGARETAQLVKCFLNKDLSFIPIIHIKIKPWWHTLSTSALGGSNRRILETDFLTLQSSQATKFPAKPLLK